MFTRSSAVAAVETFSTAAQLLNSTKNRI